MLKISLRVGVLGIDGAVDEVVGVLGDGAERAVGDGMFTCLCVRRYSGEGGLVKFAILRFLV